jgi:hypothetical protein
VALDKGDIETGTAVFAGFNFARFLQVVFWMAEKRDGYMAKCKNNISIVVVILCTLLF